MSGRSTSIGTTFGHYLKPSLTEEASMPSCSDADPCEAKIAEVSMPLTFCV